MVFRSLKKTRKSACTLFTTVCNSSLTYTTYKPSHRSHTIIPLSNHHTIIILKSIELRNIYIYTPTIQLRALSRVQLYCYKFSLLLSLLSLFHSTVFRANRLTLLLYSFSSSTNIFAACGLAGLFTFGSHNKLRTEVNKLATECTGLHCS